MSARQRTHSQPAEQSTSPTMRFVTPPPSIDAGQSSTESAVQSIQSTPVVAPSLASVNVHKLTDRVYDLMRADAKKHRNRVAPFRQP
jgi:hypothetical protein